MHADDLRAYARRPWLLLAALERDQYGVARLSADVDVTVAALRAPGTGACSWTACCR